MPCVGCNCASQTQCDPVEVKTPSEMREIIAGIFEAYQEGLITGTELIERFKAIEYSGPK